MTIKTCKTAVRASAVLAAIALSGGAFAAAAVGESYNFETDGTLGTSPYQALNGNGTIVADGYSYTARAGYPLTADSHTKVLEIAGTVTYTNAGDTAATTSSQVDFMFKVEPTDELENPTDGDSQVALAVGTNAANTTTAPIKLWCKTVSGSASADWVALKEAAATGSWVRATLVLDYSTTPGRCKVSLDGDPVLNPQAEPGAQGSEWFYFAGTASQAFVKSISMVGSTRVDDLKVSYDALNSYTMPTATSTIADGSAVTYDYINKYGVTVAEAQSSTPLNAASGMSVADKFAAGLDPKSATKFELQTMTTTKSQAVVTFPGTRGTGGYTVKVGTTKGGYNVATQDSTQTDANGEGMNSATINIPAAYQDQLLYFSVSTKGNN